MGSNVQQKDYELSEVTLANGKGDSFNMSSNGNGYSNGHGRPASNSSNGTMTSLVLCALSVMVVASLAIGAVTYGMTSSLASVLQPVKEIVNAETYHFDLSKQYYAHRVNRPPGFDGMSWQDTVKQANGQTVKFWMWSGNTNINAWVDNWLAPQMLSHFGVTVERHPEGAVAAV